jgi:hypothetical protein
VEYVIKIVWTMVALVSIWGLSAFTIKIWRSHVDPSATLTKIVGLFQKPPTELIATREDNALYQDGKIVGRVIGTIEEQESVLVFEEVTDTSNLKRNESMEFRRMKIKFEGPLNFTGITINTLVSDSGQSSSVSSAIIPNMRCRIISR